jgi:hypothetical protein
MSPSYPLSRRLPGFYHGGMRWEDWKFSARLAWQDAWMRWMLILSFVLLFGMTAFLLFRLLPEGWKTGVVTIHYNVYLGIDDVRSWPWIFVLPGGALLVMILDALLSLGFFRAHPLASRTLMSACLATAIIWAVGSFYLIRVNT